ncbi:unnamed protein product [Gongylonema pulchrum]|uniref:CW-type domain-containing protein n=1 Tax=Gongylonema pulchrum TaxID=637853 RepID=A0A183DN21_9BILA|nr:unnamed protein product [Gongylonema pulchrum]
MSGTSKGKGAEVYPDEWRLNALIWCNICEQVNLDRGSLCCARVDPSTARGCYNSKMCRMLPVVTCTWLVEDEFGDSAAAAGFDVFQVSRLKNE